MDGNVSFWKSRALQAEDQLSRIKLELEMEKQKRVDFEMMVTDRFDLFCQQYEEKLLLEIEKTKQVTDTAPQVIRINTPITGERISITPYTHTKHEKMRSYTPTPRRAPPVPPGRILK